MKNTCLMELKHKCRLKLLLLVSSVKPQSEDVKPLRRKFKTMLFVKNKNTLWFIQDCVSSLVYESKILWIFIYIFFTDSQSKHVQV